MPRIRSIKPEFWDDRRLACDLTREQRLFYIGLWNQADDAGRFLADPRRLLGAIFPYEDDLTPAFVLSALAKLAETDRAVLYDADGESYGQLTKFPEHQRISHPTDSKIPAPRSGKFRNGSGKKRSDSGLRARAGVVCSMEVEQGDGIGTGSRDKELEPGSAPDREILKAEMNAAATAFGKELETAEAKGAFKGLVRVIISGDDSTAWRDPKEGGQVPWEERPRLLNVAIGKLEAGERDDIRRALQLAIQQQFDPFALKVANAPAEGSESDNVRRGKSDPLPMGPQQSKEDAEERRVAEWCEAHPDQVREIHADIEIWFRERAADWHGTHPAIIQAKTKQLHREHVLKRMKSEAA